jgi:hypothetical protein
MTLRRKVILLKTLSLLALIWTILTVTFSLSWAGDLDPSRFMPVDDIQPGMKGYGLTVFSGTKIDTFEAEIIGVLKGVVPKGDLILARLSGGQLEKTGIFAGMSGSPVYIEGRLIGAAAYGWLYATDPIAGITPIGEMLDIWEIPSNSRDTKGNGSFGLHVPFGEGQRQTEDIPIPPDFLATHHNSPPSSDAFLRQWGAPLALAGFDDRVIDQMAPVFEHFGLTPVQGGSAPDETEIPPLRPGSTVAAQLIRGDASAAVVGTVTHIQGDRVLAFGHPMSRAGNINIPMTGGVVHTVFPSRQRSFKMTSATGPVGTFVQDRRPGTAGFIGSSAQTIPCHVDIKREDGGPQERYSYEIVNDLFFTPNLVGWTVANSILATERLSGFASIRIQTEIAMENHPPLILENFYSGNLTWLTATSDAIVPISLLMDNPFEEAKIKAIDLTIWSEEALHIASIDEMYVNTLTVKPGDSIELTFTLKPYQEPPSTKKVTLAIPDDTPDGLARVVVADAKSIKSFEKARAPYALRPETLNQLINLLETRERNNEVVAMIYRIAHGITVGGQELPSPPSSLVSVMSSSKAKGDVGPTKGTVLSKERIPTDYFIVGSHSIDLKIDRMSP